METYFGVKDVLFFLLLFSCLFFVQVQASSKQNKKKGISFSRTVFSFFSAFWERRDRFCFVLSASSSRPSTTQQQQ